MKQITFKSLSGRNDTSNNLRVEQMAISGPQMGRLTELHGNFGIHFELVGADYNTGLDMGLKEVDLLSDKAFTERLCAMTGVGSIAEMDGKLVEVKMQDHATVVAIRQDGVADLLQVSERALAGDWLFIAYPGDHRA